MSVCAFNVVNILHKEEGRLSLNSEVEKRERKECHRLSQHLKNEI